MGQWEFAVRGTSMLLSVCKTGQFFCVLNYEAIFNVAFCALNWAISGNYSEID